MEYKLNHKHRQVMIKKKNKLNFPVLKEIS